MSNDDEINGESPLPAAIDTETRAFLKLVGFTAAEIEGITDNPTLNADNLPLVAIARLAQRVAAMEAYLRAKIASDRSGRIITPYKN